MPWEGWIHENLLCWRFLMLNSCCSIRSPNMMNLKKFSLLFPMYKVGLLVLQALSMYCYRRLLSNSQLYSSCYLVRELPHSSTLDNLVAHSTHTPMSSSNFLFSYKTMSHTVMTICFNIIRSVLKYMILSQNSSTGHSSSLLNVFVPFYTGFPTTIASTWKFHWHSRHGSSYILYFSCCPTLLCSSFHVITTVSSFDSPWMSSS